MDIKDKSDTTCEILARAMMPDCTISIQDGYLNIGWLGQQLVIPHYERSKYAQAIINQFRDNILLKNKNYG